MKTTGLQKTANNVFGFVSKNSPTILTCMGVFGLVTTTVMAIEATPKALDILAEASAQKEYDHGTDELDPMEIVKLTYKCYIPTAVMGSLTVACIIGANSINLRRNAALATVYSLTEATLKEYQSKVVSTIGEVKEKAIKDEIAKDKIEKNKPKKSNVVITGKGDTLCYDSISGRYFKSDIEKIKSSVNELNRDLLYEMFVSLNDVYYALGLSNIKMGDQMGWHIDNGMILFDYSSQLTEDGVPCLVIDYLISPRFDYRDM